MAGCHGSTNAYARANLPESSQGWQRIGFAEWPSRATQGLPDVRVPLAFPQLPRVPITTYPGAQLRQPLSLLSQGYNVSFSAHTYQQYQPQAVQLQTRRVSTGLGLGKLKNMDLNAQTTASNLLAKASRFGRLSSHIPVA